MIVKNVVDTIATDAKGEKETEDKLAELDELAQAKLGQLDGAQRHMIDSGKLGGDGSETLPVDKVVGEHIKKHAVTEDSYNIEKVVDDILLTLSRPDDSEKKVPVVIAQILDALLTGITGEEKGSEENEHHYVVVAEYGGLIRYDVSTWTKSIDTTKINRRQGR